MLVLIGPFDFHRLFWLAVNQLLKYHSVRQRQQSEIMYQRRFGNGDRLEHSGVYYLDFMALLNRQLQPRSYFEVGTDTGLSLNCFSCDAVCVDPNFQVAARVWQARRRTLMFQSTSDDFFAQESLRTFFPAGLDLAFLDGMHRSEYLLRDFINTERSAHHRTLVLFHDCLPLNTRMAERVARQGDEAEGHYRDAWTGDIWRVLFALQVKRPELRVRYLDCPPTGLIAISNLDPSSTVLRDNYNSVVDMMLDLDLSEIRLRELWGMHPFLNTAALAATPTDVSAVLNCR